MNLKKTPFVNFLHLIIFFFFMNSSECLLKKILISNNDGNFGSFNQTFDDFYENLFEAFHNTTEKYSNSTEEDIFLFKLFPTEQTYVINDDQLINKSGDIFQNFKGNKNSYFYSY